MRGMQRVVLHHDNGDLTPINHQLALEGVDTDEGHTSTLADSGILLEINRS